MAEARRRLPCRRTRPGAQAGPVLLVLLAAACGQQAADPLAAYVNVRDSAGIQIVENGPLASVDTLGIVVDSAGRMRIGLVDGDAPYLFERIVAATRLSDGRIAIGESGSAEIRFFDDEGRFLSAEGGKGGGPGEYVNFYNFHPLRADSLLIVDYEGLRWHFAGSDGVPGWRREAPRYPPTRGTYSPSYRLRDTYADGTLLVSRGVPSGCPPYQPDLSVLCTDSIRLLRMDRAGEVLADFGVSASTTVYSWRAAGGPSISLTNLYGDGRSLVAGMQTYIAHGSVLELRRFDPDGRLVRIVRIAEPAHPMPESWPMPPVTDEESRILAARLQEAFEAAPKPPHFPMFTDIVTERVSGSLWIRLAAPPGQEARAGLRWAVVDSAGVLRHVIRTPNLAGPSPFSLVPTIEIGQDHLLNIARDSFQVPVVDLYPIVRREP
ncbi:MAG: hypothetical protein WEA24_05430 [Gemmatimonadota bacterium]